MELFDHRTFTPEPARGKLDKVIEHPFTCEAKLDGVRAVLWHLKGEDYLTGRRTSKVSGEKIDRLPWVPQLREFSKWAKGDFIIDGELCLPGCTSNEVMSLIGTKVPTIPNELQYVVFDCLFFEGKDWRSEPLSTRQYKLETLYRTTPAENAYKYIKLVPCFGKVVESCPDRQAFIDAAYYSAVSAGYEGLVVKRLDSPYSKQFWAKLKPVEEYDFVFAGTVPSDSTTYQGWGVASISLGLYRDGVLCHVGECSGLTEEERKEFFDHGTMYFNKTVTVRAQQMFPTGAVRHPRFVRIREDVDATEQTFAKYGL